MQGHVLLLIGAVCLSGCAQAVSEACPQMKTYSPKVQTQAADELDALPQGSVLPVFIGDYAVMREELRAGGCGS
jgi:uncharacterized protein YceK